MYDTTKTSKQICPHCYRETEVLLDAGDEESVLGEFKCRHCRKKFTLLDAAKAKVSKNTGVYPGQDRTSPFYLEGVPPNSNAAKTHSIIAAILLIGIPISFRLAKKFAMKGSFGKFSQAAYDYLSDLFLKVLMGGDINTGSFEAFIRLGLFGLFCAVFFAILYSVVKIFRLDRKIVIKFKK